MVSKTEIGQSVRALRQDRDLSQGQLAAILKIPATNVSAIERGVRGLSIQHLVRLAKALEVSPAEILDGHSGNRSRRTVTPRMPRRFERIRSLPRTKRRVLYEIIDAFLDKHG